jgi:hypothetical protein
MGNHDAILSDSHNDAGVDVSVGRCELSQVEKTIIRMADLKQELASRLEAAQTMLFGYVNCRVYPIKERFEVWAEWCEKRHYDRGNLTDIPFFQRMVSLDVPYEFYRYEKFDWLFFLEQFSEDGQPKAAKYREQFGVTSDDVRELIIKHNFGSFTMDW